jgi:small subunit ribosomal protein S17
MAEETPENVNEEVEEAAAPEAPAAPEAETPEAPAAPEAETPEAETPAPAEPAPAATRRGKLEQRRAARQAERGSRGPRTVEERVAEREAHRERNARQRRAYRAKQKAKRAEARAAQPAPEPPPATEHGPGRPKTRQGVVVSDKADKTITVRVDVAHRHRRYRKIMRTSSTFHAHDEGNEAHAGDTVRIVETRPMSRTKRWRLVEILERAR